MESFLAGVLGVRLAVEPVLTPHVNFTPSQRTNAVLRELGLEEADDTRAWCRNFAFLFLVELLCTSVRGMSADHIVRFLYLDVLRRHETGQTLKRTLTESEKVEFVVYANALAYRIYRLRHGDRARLGRHEVVRVERSRDAADRPLLRVAERRTTTAASKSKKGGASRTKAPSRS